MCTAPTTSPAWSHQKYLRLHLLSRYQADLGSFFTNFGHQDWPLSRLFPFKKLYSSSPTNQMQFNEIIFFHVPVVLLNLWSRNTVIRPLVSWSNEKQNFWCKMYPCILWNDKMKSWQFSKFSLCLFWKEWLWLVEERGDLLYSWIFVSKESIIFPLLTLWCDYFSRYLCNMIYCRCLLGLVH